MPLQNVLQSVISVRSCPLGLLTRALQIEMVVLIVSQANGGERVGTVILKVIHRIFSCDFTSQGIESINADVNKGLSSVKIVFASKIHAIVSDFIDSIKFPITVCVLSIKIYTL